jgi:hypothetical protein
MVTVSRNDPFCRQNRIDIVGGAVIDAQSCSMERRRRGGVQIISTYFRARHEVRINNPY